MNPADPKVTSMTRRGIIITSLMLLSAGVLLTRLFGLQVLAGQKYQKLSERNRFSFRLVAPQRGLIKDRAGTVIAGNTKAFRLTITPEQVKELPRVLARVAALVGLTEDRLNRVKRDIRRQAAFLPVTIKDFLDYDEVARVQVNLPHLPGVDVAENLVREYPYGKDFSQVLGYTAPPSKEQVARSSDPMFRLPELRIGRRGLEERFDASLRGSAGTRQVEVNARGRDVRIVSETPAKDGADMTVSLVKELQEAAWKALGDHRGSIVVMDVISGEVLVSASNPSFDPNLFVTGLSDEVWRGLLQDPARPMVNRVTQGLYAPGSTFKAVVALAALEEKLIPAGERITCTGHMQFGDRRFHCWRERGHGAMNLSEAMAHSCDIYFYELGHRLGIEKIAHYARMLGLGEHTGIEIADDAGLVPTPAWKRRRRGAAWVGGENLITAIGQGYLQTTPLQLAVMTARLASGKAVRPTFVHYDAPLVFDDLPVDPRNLERVRQMLDDVVNKPYGTAYHTRSTRIPFAGKTGTSQVISRRHGENAKLANIPVHERTNALFVAFGPTANPRLAMSVILENAGSGSGTAAPMARGVFLASMDWLRKFEA